MNDTINQRLGDASIRKSEKSFNNELKWKIKVICKSLSIGNEDKKNMSDISLWFTWNYVRVKKYVEKPNTKEMGATAAVELCLALHYQGSG